MSIEKEYKRMKWEGRCPYDSFEEYVDSFLLGFENSREGAELSNASLKNMKESVATTRQSHSRKEIRLCNK